MGFRDMAIPGLYVGNHFAATGFRGAVVCVSEERFPTEPPDAVHLHRHLGIPWERAYRLVVRARPDTQRRDAWLS